MLLLRLLLPLLRMVLSLVVFMCSMAGHSTMPRQSHEMIRSRHVPAAWHGDHARVEQVVCGVSWVCITRGWRIPAVVTRERHLRFKARSVVGNATRTYLRTSEVCTSFATQALRLRTPAYLDQFCSSSDTARQRDHAWHEASAWCVDIARDVLTCNAQPALLSALLIVTADTTPALPADAAIRSSAGRCVSNNLTSRPVLARRGMSMLRIHHSCWLYQHLR
jgi:hypothetical protein